MELKEADIGHIYKFKEALQAEQPVVVKNRVSNGKPHKSVSIYISSAKVVQSLELLGVGKRKSFTVKPCEQISENLLSHYWRGLIDGDGSIMFRQGVGRKYWSIKLCGNEAIVKGFQIYANQLIQSTTQTTQYRNIYQLVYQGNRQVKTIVEKLYGNATVYLQRKASLAFEILEGSKVEA